MFLFLPVVLLYIWGPAQCTVFEAAINMEGVTGWVKFDSSLKIATLNLTGAEGPVNVFLMEFPVMYGHFAKPCQEQSVGTSVFTFTAIGPSTKVNVSKLFEQRSHLDDLSVVLETASHLTVCGNVHQNVSTRTWQARFFNPVAGDVYVRQNVGEDSARVLSSLVSLPGKVAEEVVTAYVSHVDSPTCEALINNLKPSSLLPLGALMVGSSAHPAMSHREISNFSSEEHFVLLKIGETFTCSEIREMDHKVVHVPIDMKGVKGMFTFSQASPFDVTEISVNLTHLEKMAGPYHVHHFPVPEKMSPEEDICSHDNVGDHWNPFHINVDDPAYPHAPGATHDMYEVGDLSGRHGSLANFSDYEAIFSDWNLPLFGTNSIVGRSVVVHRPDGVRFLCGSIGYPGEVAVLKSVFTSPVVGTIHFTQPKNNPYSDVSIFADLAYANPSMPVSHGHRWHIHQWPISTEKDSDESHCRSTGNHWNPFHIDTSDSIYTTSCMPENPFACEIGDLAGKHKPLDLTPGVGKFEAKHFITDTTSWVTGTDSMVGRSLVIHGADGNLAQVVCSNVTAAHLVMAHTSTWLGAGTSQGYIRFSQEFPGLTVINVSLSNLNSKAGGFHVHILPIKGKVNPCSDGNIMGHFNPMAVIQSSSPPPGVGTVDQYEIGDISGKFGLLTSLDKSHHQYTDSNMPLSGPNSIVGRSLVIHYVNGSRMQCADIIVDDASDGHWVKAKASFKGAVTGTITLAFKDSSHSDSTIEVDIRASQKISVPEVSWSIHSHRTGEGDKFCSHVGDRFDPFHMKSEHATCSAGHPLHCEVGDLTTRHGPINMTERHLYTETNLQLTGDFTVVYRSVVLWSGKEILTCADILPISPSETLIFPPVTSFSRFDFRRRVAAALAVDLWRVTILPDELAPVAGGKCQQVSFLVSGDVNMEVLHSIKDNEKMGPFRRSQACFKSGSSGRIVIHGRLLLFMIAVAPLLVSLVQ